MGLEYLITGTGRCGTVYCAKFFTSAGIPCGHESIFDYQGLETALNRLDGKERPILSEVSQMIVNPDGTIKRLSPYVDCGNLRAESSYLAAPFLDHDRLKDTKIVHVVRHPVSVIQSFCHYLWYFLSHEPNTQYNLVRRYESCIYRHIPELANSWLTQHERCALYYVKWNRLIEHNSQHRDYTILRIEESKQFLPKYLNINQSFDIDDRTNTFYEQKAPQFTLDNLKSRYIKSELTEYARKIGYEL